MNKGQETSKNPNKIWSNLIYVLIAVIFAAPFFRGLFFEREFYVVSAAIGFLGILIIGSKESEEFKVKSFIEYFAIAFGAMYIINLPFAYNKELASFELIKNITYIIVFIIMAKAVRKKSTMSVVINALIGSGTLIGLLGMAAGMGIVAYNGAFEAGMINSTFQYHNTFGAYMLAVLFLAMGKMGEAGKKSSYYYSICANILFMGFIFSYSRGAWVLLPPIGLMAMILMDQKRFSRIITMLVGITVSSIPFISKIQTAMNNTDKSGMTYVIISSVIISAITFVVWKFEEKIVINKKIAITAMLVAAIGLGGLVVSGGATVILPSTIAERIAAINLKTFTVVERNVFYKDAMKIVKDNAIIGSGGGGWTSLYSKYKTYDYYTTQTHNYLLQVLIETGIPGLVALIGVYAGILHQAYLYLKTKECKERMLFVGILCSVAVLALHSIIDFDMALGGYALTFWILAGLIANGKVFAVESETKQKYFKKEGKTITTKYAVVLLSIAIFAVSSSFGFATRLLEKNADLNEKNRFNDVLKNLQTAAVLNPYKVDAKIDLANTTLFMIQFEKKNEKKKALFEESQKLMDNVVGIDGNKFEYIAAETKYYLKTGDMQKAEEQMQRLLEAHPFNDNTYRLAIDMYYSIANHYAQEENADKTIEYAKKIKEVLDAAEANNEELLSIKEKLLEDVDDISESYVKNSFSIELNEATKEKINLANTVLNR